jgi:hypothetical protein
LIEATICGRSGFDIPSDLEMVISAIVMSGSVGCPSSTLEDDEQNTSARVPEEFCCASVGCWLAKNQGMPKIAFCAGPMRIAALYLVCWQTVVRRFIKHDHRTHNSTARCAGPQDTVHAYMWFLIAGEQITKAKNHVNQSMTM